jgi:hypothetical protein
MDKIKMFEEGRGYWIAYIQENGYSFEPNILGLKKLSRRLDLNVPYLKKCINFFLTT